MSCRLEPGSELKTLGLAIVSSTIRPQRPINTYHTLCIMIFRTQPYCLQPYWWWLLVMSIGRSLIGLSPFVWRQNDGSLFSGDIFDGALLSGDYWGVYFGSCNDESRFVGSWIDGVYFLLALWRRSQDRFDAERRKCDVIKQLLLKEALCGMQKTHTIASLSL